MISFILSSVQEQLHFIRKSCHIIQKNLPKELKKPHTTQLMNQYFIVNELFSLLMVEIQSFSNYEIYIKENLTKNNNILNPLKFKMNIFL